MNPVLLKVREFQFAKFSCQTATDPIWTYNQDNNLPSNAFPLTSPHAVLMIIKATEKNKGYYECEGKNKKGTTFNTFGVLVVLSKLFL